MIVRIASAVLLAIGLLIFFTPTGKGWQEDNGIGASAAAAQRVNMKLAAGLFISLSAFVYFGALLERIAKDQRRIADSLAGKEETGPVRPSRLHGSRQTSRADA